MSKERFNEIMGRFIAEGKSQSAMENIIFVLDTDKKKKNLGKALIAWKNIQVECDFSINAEDKTNDWEYIWQFCMYDGNGFALLIDEDLQTANKLVKTLKHLKLIYPTGEINSLAQGVVRALIQETINKSSGRKQKKTEG